MAEPRSWGDGANDQRVHVIEDISYAGRFIACRCGDTLSAATVNDLTAAWSAHGGSVMQFRNTAERGSSQDLILNVEEQAAAAVAALVAIGESCSCTPDSDVRDCPNYQPGDEDYDDADEPD